MLQRLDQRPNSRNQHQFDPHKIVGIIVIYGLALDGAVRFLHWLCLGLVKEFRP